MQIASMHIGPTIAVARLAMKGMVSVVPVRCDGVCRLCMCLQCCFADHRY